MTVLTRRQLLDVAWQRILQRLPKFPPADGENPASPSGSQSVAEVNLELCTGVRDGSCEACLSCCPVGEDVIDWEGGPRIDAARCTGCGVCECICETLSSGAILTRPRLPGEGT